MNPPSAPADVLVVGAPRSGTSLVGQLLAGVGFQFGRQLLPATEANPHGFYEDMEVTELSDELLAPHLRGELSRPDASGRLAWLAILRRRARRRLNLGRARNPAFTAAAPLVLAMGLIVPGAGVAFVQGSLPPFTDRHADQFSRAPAMAPLLTAAAAVPPDAPLFVDEGLAATVANRTEIGLLTSYLIISSAAFVLIERGAWVPNPLAGDRRNRRVEAVLRSQRPVVADTGRFVLLGPAAVKRP